jgi:hypothetical protein
MGKFKVVVLGHNFQVRNSSGNVQKQGFHTTLVVEANTDEEARQTALDKVRHPSEAGWSPFDLALNRGDTHDAPTLRVEEITTSLEPNENLTDFYWFDEDES